MIMCRLNNVFVHSELTVVLVHPMSNYSFPGFSMRIITFDQEEYNRKYRHNVDNYT